MAKIKKIVYIYQDLDHCEIEVFDSFEKADAHAKKQWLHEPNWGNINEGDFWHDLESDYINIYKKEIN